MPADELTRDDVLKVAQLARLSLTDAEVGAYQAKLAQMLDYIQILHEVNTDDVEPMAHAVEVQNVFRRDESLPSLTPAEALANAPKTDGRYFLVPQILDH